MESRPKTVPKWKGFLALLKQRFEKVQHFKPLASRMNSAEMFVVATGFRGA